jgi:hypothetical protein
LAIAAVLEKWLVGMKRLVESGLVVNSSWGNGQCWSRDFKTTLDLDLSSRVRMKAVNVMIVGEKYG